MNVTGHDSNLAFISCDHARTVWADQNRIRLLRSFIYTHHINHRDTFGYGDHNFDARVNRFENRIEAASIVAWQENGVVPIEFNSSVVQNGENRSDFEGSLDFDNDNRRFAASLRRTAYD